MKISLQDLKSNNSGKQYDNGYRIVYIYNDKYVIGEYCKTIEGFIIGFADPNPILSKEDIPKFVSINDLLNRHLKDIKDVNGVAIYDVDGKCIAKKIRNNEKALHK